MIASENLWIRRTRRLSQALILSATLNIGLLATFVSFILKEKRDSFAIQKHPPKEAPSPDTNVQLLRAYSLLPYPELLLRLENRELSEEGLTRRDLALACLVRFHHFHLDHALGGAALQKRFISMHSSEGQEEIDLAVFPGLTEEQFRAILHYARTEKWPLTSEGLFNELKRSPSPRDPTLLEAFSLSPEFHALHTLMTKTGVALSHEELITLLCAGEWKTLLPFTLPPLELTPDRRRAFLLSYSSPLSAQQLLKTDLEFVLKRLDDAQILTLLDLLHEKTPELETCAKELLASPRTDAVWKKAATLLYAFSGEPLPEPYKHTQTLQRFLPSAPTAQILAEVKEVLKETAPKRKLHTVSAGDNLWKIARTYRVSIEEIMRINHLETEKLRPGRQLEIPEK